MDLGKDFQQIFVTSLKTVLEEKLSIKLDSKTPKSVETGNSLNDLTVHFEVNGKNISQKIYYFMDRKFALNLMKALIKDIESIDMDNDFLLKIISDLNNEVVKRDILHSLIIKKKSIDKTEPEYSTSKMDIIKGYGSSLSEEKISMSLFIMNSVRGEFSIGFLTQEAQKKLTENNSKTSKKSFLHVKESKEEFPNSGSLISTVQLIEMKRIVLTSINEIKDLKGDGDFLLRKSKSVTELCKLWFDILKEENN